MLLLMALSATLRTSTKCVRAVLGPPSAGTSNDALAAFPDGQHLVERRIVSALLEPPHPPPVVVRGNELVESVPFLFLPHYADFAEEAVEPEVSFGNAELRGVGELNPTQSVG